MSLFMRSKHQYMPDQTDSAEDPFNTELAELQDLLNDPTAFRITRPGWENRRYLIDPTNPSVALATPRNDVREPSKYKL